MQKKYEIIIITVIIFSLHFVGKAEGIDEPEPEDASFGLYQTEKELFQSCADILIKTYEEMVSATAIHFIKEIDSLNDGLETKLLKEVSNGFYKVSIELLKYSKSVLFTKGPLLGKAKRVCAILGGFFFMHGTLNYFSNGEKNPEEGSGDFYVDLGWQNEISQHEEPFK